MGSKASAPPPPDYKPMAEASAEAAQLGHELGGRQLDEAKRQYDANMAAAKPIIESQLKTAEQTAAQGQDYYEYMKSAQRPVEAAINARALEGESAESIAERGLISGGSAALQRDPRYGAEIEAEAGQAGADQLSGYSRALNIAARQGMRYGYSPAKLAAAASSQAGAQASQIAGATNQARTAATERARGLVSAGRNLRTQEESTNFARKLDAAGLYRGLPGASQGAYSVGINAGNSAMSNQMAPGSQYMQGMGQGINTQMQGANAKMQGAGTILGSQQQYGEMVGEINAANAGAFNQTIGTAVGVGTGIAFSDRRVKENIELVGQLTPEIGLYEFEYIGGNGSRYRGVMADEVLKVMPEAVVTSDRGYMAVVYSMLGFEMEEVSHG